MMPISTGAPMLQPRSFSPRRTLLCLLGFVWLSLLAPWVAGAADAPVSGVYRDEAAWETNHLLSLRLTDMAGEPFPDAQADLIVIPLDAANPPTYRLRWDAAIGRHEGELPADVYALRTGSLPAGSYPATVLFDLRDADQVSDLQLSSTPLDPTTYDPPEAGKITVGRPDGLGEAEIRGAAGAVRPVAHVLLTNLDSLHLAHTLSRPDGSFVARIYAPPGSALLIQHGAHQWLWPASSTLAGDATAVYPLYPGTIMYVPLDPGPFVSTAGARPLEGANVDGLPFAAAGAAEYVPWGRLDASPASHVSSAWAITGTLQATGSVPATDGYAPGADFQAEGTLRIFGYGIRATTAVSDISVRGALSLVMLYNGDGLPLTPHDPVLTSRLTPTGQPIRDGRANRLAMSGAGFQVTDLRLAGEHVVEGRFLATGWIPPDAPPGVYRPVIKLTFSGLPSDDETWPAPMDYASTRPFALDEAALPPITVAASDKPAAEPRRLVWRLLMDNISQGTHGVAAREDAERFGLTSFVVTQGAPYIVPRFDARTGTPITYRLEPFLPMISSDVSPGYSPPTPPLIPFALPGGRLSVTIRMPDGSVRDLGSEPFAESFVRSQTTAGGYNLNAGTVHLHAVYSLKVATDRFRTIFDRDGHYEITLAGELEDVWGNRYVGGGTYDVWIGTPLVLAPGVLPGTPFDVGDTFNPALQLSPPVPAEVTWTIIQYPDSDPTRATRQTISGRANPFGYFSSQGMTFDAPGEYRVDVTASYQDKTGALAMGAMTWGGIVTTPAWDATLVAHGRRGTTNVEHIPGPWFVLCRDLNTIPAMVLRAYPPYYAGDILWSRREVLDTCPGESLQVAATLQDTTGVLEARIRARAERMGVMTSLPSDLSERFVHGELPLFTSTRSGNSPQMAPDDVDQLAYAYFSAQRPGVRVSRGDYRGRRVAQLLGIRYALRWPGWRGDRRRLAERLQVPVHWRSLPGSDDRPQRVRGPGHWLGAPPRRRFRGQPRDAAVFQVGQRRLDDRGRPAAAVEGARYRHLHPAHRRRAGHDSAYRRHV